MYKLLHFLAVYHAVIDATTTMDEVNLAILHLTIIQRGCDMLHSLTDVFLHDTQLSAPESRFGVFPYFR